MSGEEADGRTGPRRRVASNGGGSLPWLPWDFLPNDRAVKLEDFGAPWIRSAWASCGQLLFPALWMFIGLVSAFDTYLTVKFQEQLVYHELNPMARMLLRFDGWEPSLLVGLKFLGTLVSLGFMIALHGRSRRLGFAVAAGLATFQLGLLCYLVLG